MDIPPTVSKTKLWTRLADFLDLQNAIIGMRVVAEAIGDKVAEIIPSFTDHSVVHMDALWSVCDHVFTDEEFARISPAEAFVLGCAFYVHDLGMAFAATKDGADELSSSQAFKSHFEHGVHSIGLNRDDAKAAAMRLAARDLHAQKALLLVDQQLPGLDRFLLESKELRDQWGQMIGEISASHHWSLREVEVRLGNRGKVPAHQGGSVDLGFVACAIRVIDYAHINRARASSLSRILRSSIDRDSFKHWDAQQHITGPMREGFQLTFGCTRAIDDVDAWWTFYEMASGLDREITAVADYLEQRSISIDRFSLDGVKGVKSPQSFVVFVRANGFEPVDVRFRPDSMERLIELIGGKTLYGNDEFAPIRELIQNARDAILLNQTRARLSSVPGAPGKIEVTVRDVEAGGEITVSDNGVGMSEKIITNYLLGVAADFWNSSDFFSDYPGVVESGFKPVGRFGIGFLSVFMIGKQVEVRTQRMNGPNITLQLRGVGRRGALVKNVNSLQVGTEVCIRFPQSDLAKYENLVAIIRAKAPMLEFPVAVTEQQSTSTIEVNWWKTLTQSQLVDFLRSQPLVSTISRIAIEKLRAADHRDFYRSSFGINGLHLPSETWPEKMPEVISEHYRIFATPGGSGILVCSKGIALSFVHIQGIAGMVDIPNVEINAARSELLKWNQDEFAKEIFELLAPKIREALTAMRSEVDLPSRFGFLVNVARSYGRSFLRACSEL